MAEAVRVATLYKDVQQKVASARASATIVFKAVFPSLEETLASMKPMVHEIDQSNQEIIHLLEELSDRLSELIRSKVVGLNPRHMAALKVNNEKLKRFLRDYVQLSLSNIDDEVEEGEPTIKLRELLTRLLGMIINEWHSAAESTKFVFGILDLTLDALHRQLADGELVYTDRLLPLLKKVEVLVRFHRGQYGIDIPEFLKVLERQLRRLLPVQARQPLDFQIQELLKNYVREEEKRDEEQQGKREFALGLVIIVTAGFMLFYIVKWLSSIVQGKVILSFIVLIVGMAYIWYLHEWITSKAPEPFDHVFLSCRADILKTHAEPLNKALQKVQLRTFYYGERKNSGRRIEDKLKEGIDRSASAIIIFSKEFARSNWCLDEVVLILERSRKSNYPIIPIYCDGVNYRNLMVEKGSIYHAALETHKTIYEKKKVDEWIEALKDVGGREFKRATGSESELKTFFKQVAEEIKKEITRLCH